MTPFFIAAVKLGVFSRYLRYCPVCRHYRIGRTMEAERPRLCDVCGTELESVKNDRRNEMEALGQSDHRRTRAVRVGR